MAQQAGTQHPVQGAVEQIAQLVRRNRSLWRRLIVIEGVGLTLSAVLGYFWVVLLLDNVLHLPMIGRIAASAGLIAGIVYLCRWLLQRWRRLDLTEDQVALAIEKNTPGGVQNRLINALQIGRDERYHEHGYGQAVVSDNWQQLQALQLEHARAMRPAMMRILVAVGVIALGVVFWIVQPAKFANAASRILMPFAAIDPLYRTVLVVEPGDIEAEGDITIQVKIRGEHPDKVTILRNVGGRRSSQQMTLAPDQSKLEYTFKGVENSFEYAVQGGDYTSRFFHVEVPRPARLTHLSGTYELPAYTGQPERKIESAGGDLEALRGVKAKLSFTLDQELQKAAMIVEGGKGEPEQRIELTRQSATEFTGEMVFASQQSYRIESQQKDRPARRGQPYVIDVQDDREPALDLSGLDRQTEAAYDAALPIKAQASDDYGLREVTLVMRRVTAESAAAPAADAAAQPAADDPAAAWTSVQAWPGGGALSLTQPYELNVPALGVAEGDRFQVALRGTDNDPEKKDRWTTGTTYNVVIGGEGVAMQLMYEQILRSEAEMKQLIADVKTAGTATAEWSAKFRPDSGVRWDDAKTLEDFKAAMKVQGDRAQQLRDKGSAVARDMVEQAGGLRLSLGMLADTEFVRAVRIFQAIPERDTPQAKEAALGDVRLTQQRLVASMDEIAEQYTRFRREWELAHMVSYVKMMADRQTSLASGSQKLAAAGTAASDALKASAARRQTKVVEMSGLAKTAFDGLVEPARKLEPILGDAFAAASASLSAAPLQAAMKTGGDQAGAGQWSAAAAAQDEAAKLLTSVHDKLREAQSEAAKKAMAMLAEAVKGDIDAQKEIDELMAGTLENLLGGDPDNTDLKEIIRMHELAAEAKRKHDKAKDTVEEKYKWDDSMKGLLYAGKPAPPDFSVLKLAKKPTGERSFPDSSDKEGNKNTLSLLEGKFEDLVGDLLDEAEEIKDKFETYNLLAQGQGVEEGEIGKQAGDLSSVSAAAATGNQKPPSQNYGGASRSGRLGARAHGMVVGDESVNRRGRDKAQEGQEKTADQAGTIKQTMSKDPQKDTSTGIGGKRVESDDTSFSVADAGKWTDDMAGRMEKAQAKMKIVERQDGGIDSSVAEMLRDLNSDQEQVIERLKAIRKDLKNLYLPTDHIDQSLAELTANLEALKDSPNPEVFRQQQAALDRLRGTLQVFRTAQSDFQPSLPRQQTVKGRVLDEPARPPLPGYEQAVKQYYELLSTR